jgi:tetratricopeptide (TPR) repeat protein
MNPTSSTPTLKVSGVFDYSDHFNLYDLGSSIDGRDDAPGVTSSSSRSGSPQQQNSLQRPMMRDLFRQIGTKSIDALNSHLPAVLKQDSYRSADDSDASLNDLSFTSLVGPGEGETFAPSAEFAHSLSRRGAAMLRSGQYDDALAYFQQALPLQREVFGPRHKLVAATLNNTGVTYKYLSRQRPQQRDMYERLAISSFEEALNILQQEFGPNNKVTAKTLDNLWQMMQTVAERKSENGQYVSRDVRFGLTARSA